jgi:hypothetical protein
MLFVTHSLAIYLSSSGSFTKRALRESSQHTEKGTDSRSYDSPSDLFILASWLDTYAPQEDTGRLFTCVHMSHSFLVAGYA